MSKIHTGGAAFPHKAKHWDSDSGCYVASLDHHEPGMTLRDYFAAAALPSILSYSNEIRAKADAEWAEREGIAKPCDLNDDTADSETLSYRSSSCAIAAYIIADAMLAARKEGA
jgi:hypothetical protein